MWLVPTIYTSILGGLWIVYNVGYKGLNITTKRKNKMTKQQLIDWIYGLDLQVLTDELKEEIVRQIENIEY